MNGIKPKAQEAYFNDQGRFSPETVRSYKIALSQFFSYCDKPIKEVKAKDIRNWLASLNEKDLKPRSIQLKLSAVKSFYQYCLEENIVNINPTLKIRTPAKEDSLPYYLDKRQIALLQELVRENI
ncbi:site-specific integrase [Priestia koreensis]|uniref:site-specific integrase n=1 Tax=Priestia koreensis TaxID=284581 RepID=UPI00301A773B